MTDIADLEMSLNKAVGGKYSVELRFTLPKSDAETRIGADVPILAEFDLATLQGLIGDPAEHGKLLTGSLFADEKLRTGFAQARASAGAAVLRVRLVVGSGAPELNTVYWETLLDPADQKAQLFTNENILYSRYLASTDWRPVQLRAKGALSALAAAANPSDLADYKLAAVDVPGELARAQTALGLIPLEKLGAAEPCTLNALLEKLRAGVDILYLVVHGTSGAGGEPRLWLQDDTGKAAITSADDFVLRMKELPSLPRLVVLASCESAGQGTGDVLQAFGPRLAQAGVPAVIAMQGKISMESVEKFMPVFFTELEKDGQIDRALAVARGVIRDRYDFWMPVLFMRLKSGRVWYVPGLGDEGEEFDKWPTIVSSIRGEQCTPILGPGLYEPLIGSWQEMASALSDQFNFPLADFLRSSLPNVTQYVSVSQDLNTLYMYVDAMIRTALQSRFAADLSDALKTPDANLLDLLALCGARARERDVAEQHRVLASLPIRIYVTTNYDNLMAEALKEAGKAPEVVICPWREGLMLDESVYDREPGYLPTKERPLVYHLFGHLSLPDSMVLTEDDYFEFLIGFTANKKRTPQVIPPAVLRALTDSALLVLGFHLDDWSFRALFRTVMIQQGGGRRARYSHVGVQLEPEDTRNQNPVRARKYLEKYFGQAEINLYWGKSEDFVHDLARQWKPA